MNKMGKETHVSALHDQTVLFTLNCCPDDIPHLVSFTKILFNSKIKPRGRKKNKKEEINCAVNFFSPSKHFFVTRTGKLFIDKMF